MPRRSARLRIITTRQRGIYNIANKDRAIVTIAIAKTIAKIASKKMARLTVTPSRPSCCLAPFQLAHAK